MMMINRLDDKSTSESPTEILIVELLLQSCKGKRGCVRIFYECFVDRDDRPLADMGLGMSEHCHNIVGKIPS